MSGVFTVYIILAVLVSALAYKYAHKPDVWSDLQGVLGWFGNDQRAKQACMIIGFIWPYVAVRLVRVIIDVIVEEIADKDQ